MEKRHLRVNALAHGTAHEKISCIGNQRDGCHFQKRSGRGNYRKAGIFSGGSVAQGTGQKGLKGCEPCVFSSNAEGKGYGKITEANGNTIPKALQNCLFILFYRISFHDVTFSKRFVMNYSPIRNLMQDAIEKNKLKWYSFHKVT